MIWTRLQVRDMSVAKNINFKSPRGPTNTRSIDIAPTADLDDVPASQKAMTLLTFTTVER